MNQEKIGGLLKALRKEKNLTQQQLAEVVNVSNRTVSRWETGTNMPDLEMVIELADYYEVDIREILDGERKSEKMNKEMKETLIKVADYSNGEKKNLVHRMHIFFIVGIMSMMVFLVFEYLELSKTGPVGFVSGITLGISLGTLILGALYTSRYFDKFRENKKNILKIKHQKQ